MTNRTKVRNQCPFPCFSQKDGYQIVQIKLQDLLFIESAGNYVTFFEAEKKTVARMKLSEALEKLPSQNFLRIHKCHAINLSKVEKIEKQQVLISGKNLPVSDRYREKLMKSIIIKQ